MNKVVLESAKGVKNGKVQLCFSQLVDLGRSSNNVLAILNASDERFSQQKPRYAWITVSPEDASKEFGIDFSSLQEGDEMEIGAANPVMTSFPEKELNLRIVETTKGSDYDVANFETRAKRAGKDGDFILHKGMYIYTNTTLTAGPANHILIPVEETTRSSAGASTSDAIAAALD
jgi:hypothetical protein